MRSISFFFLLFLCSVLFLSIIMSKSLSPRPSCRSGLRLMSSSLSESLAAGRLFSSRATACSFMSPSPSLSEIAGRAGIASRSSSESAPNASLTTFFFLLSTSLPDLDPDLLLDRDLDLDLDLDLLPDFDRLTDRDRDLDLEPDLLRLLPLSKDWLLERLPLRA